MPSSRPSASISPQDPDRNPYFAYRTRFDNRMVRIVGDMAFVTYKSVFPTQDMPGFHGPETGYEMKILERVEGRWLIVGHFVLDDQFGQTDVPIWEVDDAGRIIRQNPAATRHLETEPDSELRVRAGRLQLGDAETNRRLHEAIREAADAAWGGVMATGHAIPIVTIPATTFPPASGGPDAREPSSTSRSTTHP